MTLDVPIGCLSNLLVACYKRSRIKVLQTGPSQLEIYRQDPGRHLGPLCAAVAAVILGDGARADEVADEVRREVGA